MEMERAGQEEMSFVSLSHDWMVVHTREVNPDCATKPGMQPQKTALCMPKLPAALYRTGERVEGQWCVYLRLE